MKTVLIGVGLLALTTLSFALSRLQLGAFALPIAMAIAVAKVSAIAWFYMHLREQPAGSRLTVLVACSLAAILIVLVLLEAADRSTLANVPGPFIGQR